MFEKIRKMKNQKGFTLVELIVVLVILAILAAMLVPALTGYIDKANNEKIIATTRQVVMAAQTEVSEAYASKTLTNNKKITIASQGNDEANTEVTGASIVKLAEVGDYDSNSEQFTLKNSISNIEITYDDKGNVTKVALTQGKKTCTYEKGGVSNAAGYDYTSGDYGVKNS